MRAQLSWAIVLVLACERASSEQPVAAAEPVAAIVAPVPEPIPPERRCGEAGREPTALPPLLAEGMPVVGEGSVKPGETVKLGPASLEYDEDAWIGSRGAGSHGAAVQVLVDQAETNGAPWGHQVRVQPGHDERFELGPYHIETSVGEAAPFELRAVVRKNPCPSHAEMEPTTEPRSFWISTEAIRLQTFDVQGEMVQATLLPMGDVQMLQISTLGQHQRFVAKAGEQHRVRVNERIVTIDEIVAGKAPAQFHARVRIEPAPKATEETAIAAEGCGSPSPQRTTLPPALTNAVPVVDELHMMPGDTAKSGTLSLELVDDDGAFGLQLKIATPDPLVSSWMTFPPDGGYPTFARLGSTLVRADPASDGELRVRRMQLGCAPTLTLPSLATPTTFWLSSHGLRELVIEAPKRLRVELHAQASEVSIGADTEQAYVGHAIRPERREAASLDGWLVEVIDVVATGDTRFEEHRWHTSAALPGVHVQLRVGPHDPRSPISVEPTPRAQ